MDQKVYIFKNTTPCILDKEVRVYKYFFYAHLFSQAFFHKAQSEEIKGIPSKKMFFIKRTNERHFTY